MLPVVSPVQKWRENHFERESACDKFVLGGCIADKSTDTGRRPQGQKANWKHKNDEWPDHWMFVVSMAPLPMKPLTVLVHQVWLTLPKHRQDDIAACKSELNMCKCSALWNQKFEHKASGSFVFVNQRHPKPMALNCQRGFHECKLWHFHEFVWWKQCWSSRFEKIGPWTQF